MNRIVIRLAVVVEVEAEIEQAVGAKVPADVGFKGRIGQRKIGKPHGPMGKH